MLRRLLALALLAAPVGAEVVPHPLFTDGAVLQRDRVVPVWGTAQEGERVEVRVGDQTVHTVARAGKWRVELQPRPAGGPYQMTVRGNNTLTFNNLVYGDVYLCSGQSNMEWTVEISAEKEQLLAEPLDPQLRLFLVERHIAERPEATPVNQAGWNSPRARMSAVGYTFGRYLRRAEGVPIGLISASWGGTIAEAWTRREALAGLPLGPSVRPAPGEPNHPALLYNGMIAPLQPYAIRGAIWYQGEANTGRAAHYQALLTAMIGDWRKLWGCGEFPFLLVQLAPYQQPSAQPADSDWARLREAQRQVARTVPNTAMVVITDLGDEDIHPLRKQPVGERLGMAARHFVYGEALEWSGPQVESVEPQGDGLLVRFSHVGSGLVCQGDQLTDFALASAYGKFHWAEAAITSPDTVLVRCPEIKQPKRLRFGWSISPRVNLVNSFELPASPFETSL
ncbi:hypothetical protein ABS71_13620 [bacterium SCN 62-11]|nr:MAG: hypothetical protein ABS71_13620 [bacterium SCN 62-11]